MMGTTYYFYVSGFSSFSEGAFEISVECVTVLPVELLSFEGKAMDKTNMLNWATASEENTQYHIIERSVNGRNDWSMVGKQDAAGFTTTLQEYNLEDTRPLAKAYYRLRSVDFDGYEDISDVIYLERKTDRFDIIGTYPNPTAGMITVDYSVISNREVTISLTNMLGQSAIHSKHSAVAGINSENIDLSNLSNGVYFITINNGTEKITRRVVKH